MFSHQTGLLEIALRVSVIYLALLLLVRLSGKRELGQLTPIDLLTILILGGTVRPALTANDTSVTGSIVAATTLIAWSVLLNYLVFKSRRFERWIHGTPKTLIGDGKLQAATLAKERVTRQELEVALRQHGLESPGDVAKAVLEPSGRISVLEKPRADGADGARAASGE